MNLRLHLLRGYPNRQHPTLYLIRGCPNRKKIVRLAERMHQAKTEGKKELPSEERILRFTTTRFTEELGWHPYIIEVIVERCPKPHAWAVWLEGIVKLEGGERRGQIRFRPERKFGGLRIY